jgi:hypothetical protein
MNTIVEFNRMYVSMFYFSRVARMRMRMVGVLQEQYDRLSREFLQQEYEVRHEG